MKKLLYSGMTIALIAGCTPQLPKNQYVLNGSIPGINDQYIYMAYAVNDTTVVTDSAHISQGAFTFKGTLDSPYRSVSLYMGSPNDYMNPKRYRLYMEPADMTITFDTANFSKPAVTGSFTQAQVDSLEYQTAQIMNEAQPIQEAMAAETDHEKAAALREKMEPYYERVQKVQTTFLKTHPDSYAAPEYMRFLMGNMTYREIKEIYDNFSDNVKKYGDVKEIEEELASLARVQPGQPAPDFATLNVHGDSIRFSEVVKGKYVLLDFWASWCVPCRKSFPHVKQLYKKYHGKGLEVFCVADNDGQPDIWRKAIKDDGVEMFHHVLRGMKVIDHKTYKLDKTNDISDKYAIHYLPTKYLIDKDFKIIGKFNDKELDNKLKEIFGE